MNGYFYISFICGVVLGITVFIEVLHIPHNLTWVQSLDWKYNQSVCGVGVGLLLVFVCFILTKLSLRGKK